MSRAFIPASLALTLAVPVQAASQHATIGVTLTVEPTCAVTIAPAPQRRETPPTVACANEGDRNSPQPVDQRSAYTMRTIRSRDGTVLQIDF